MLELAPGVYASPNLNEGVRERIWTVCCEWAGALPDDGGVLMTWREPKAPSRQGVRVLGWPKKEFVEIDGMWLDRADVGSLTTE
jgi:CRISPR-associated protein Cas2